MTRETREWRWEVTGWKANALGFILLAVPVLLVFGAGLWVGRFA